MVFPGNKFGILVITNVFVGTVCRQGTYKHAAILLQIRRIVEVLFIKDLCLIIAEYIYAPTARVTFASTISVPQSFTGTDELTELLLTAAANGK